MADFNEAVRFIIESYYGNDLEKAALATGFSQRQIQGWLENRNRPQKRNVGWLMHRALAPEFKVIAEYQPIETSKDESTVHSQLRKIFKGYENASGLYAFYDSMANLVYIGKSNGNLSGECYQRLRARLKAGVFPKGATQPETRLDTVRYVSAYYVQGSDFEDYAKHIESLILRISKPVLNRNIGTLEVAVAPVSG